MTLSDSLLHVASEFAEATGRSRARVSTLIANDGKFLARLTQGRNVTTRRYEAAMRWLSEHWPPERKWPEGIDRPALREEGAA